MVDRIGRGGSLAQEALLAAVRRQAEAASRVQEAARSIEGGAAGALPAGTSAAAAPEEGGFGAALSRGVEAVDEVVRGAERLPEEVVTGRVDEFHELAARLKQADLTFKFALEVRNKLIDAYREVMRMSV